jgi:hypothetical protein
MMKTVFSATTFLLFFQQLHAQISFLPELGMNFANLSVSANDPVNTIEKCTDRVRLKAGFSFKFKLINGFFFQPSLFHSGKGGNTEGRYAEFAGHGRFNLYQVRGNIKLNYYELPLNFGYEKAIGKIGSFFATAGIYWAYTSEGSKCSKYYLQGASTLTSTEDVLLRFGKRGEMKHSDMGMNVGAGYETPFHLFLKAQYGLGFGNISNWDGIGYRNKGFSFTLGYDFKIPRSKKEA